MVRCPPGAAATPVRALANVDAMQTFNNFINGTSQAAADGRTTEDRQRTLFEIVSTYDLARWGRDFLEAARS